MNEVTCILSAIEQGDPHAAEQLLPLVYDELRKLATQKLAHEKPGQTLEATALVHEAYLRLVDGDKAQHWNSRGHFFAAAGEAMRRILVDNARRKQRPKHGGDRQRIKLDEACCLADEGAEQVLLVNDALEQLAKASFVILPACPFKRRPRRWAFRVQPRTAIGLTQRYSFTVPWRTPAIVKSLEKREAIGRQYSPLTCGTNFKRTCNGTGPPTR
jgi:RNA polymerase sigma factor (TIGR02999 family)